MTTATDVSTNEVSVTPWWLVLIEAIALILLGILFLTQPGMTAVVTVQLLGIYWLLAGILKIVSIFIDSSQWGWKLIVGIIGIVAGIVVLRHPLWSTVLVGNTLIIVLGIFGIVMGIVSIIQAFRGAGWGTGILGVVTFILGLLLLGNAWVLTISLPLTLGILAIIGGIVALFGAFRLRSEQKAAEAAAEAEAAARGGAMASADAAEEAEEEVAVADEPAGAATAETAAAAAAVAAAESAEEEVSEVDETAGAAAAGTAAAAESALDEADEEEDPGAADFPSDLEYIEGVGPAYAKQLMDAGINTPAELLEKGATPQGRKEIIESTGISRKLILTWINHTDLYRIRGVGSEYAELLEAAGVDTVVELSHRNASNLHAKMVEVNEKKHLVRRTPSESQVESWVGQAKELPRKISY
jgi:uncharacterized membrane protein HdeD (DUF308 family)/predicted flap endonuclease-1-like 5' DNA nuclease